jgi:hypothetical protein
MNIGISSPVRAEHQTNTRVVQDAAIVVARTKLLQLISTWSQPNERYADLRSRARSSAAHELVFSIYHAIAEHEQQTGSRVRIRHVKSGVKFADAIERFVGDLLRAREGSTTPAIVYHPVGKSSFTRDPVKYDMFIRALEGLKALGLVGHRKGQTRYRKTEFDPGESVSVALAGRAARFWPTGKLVRLAANHSINTHNVGSHFAPEPPAHPLVLRDFATGRGRNREQGRIVKYKRTPGTERLEADIRELNRFLARFTLRGGEHYGYTRVFNNLSWRAGGRLYSPGHSYQQLSKVERLNMTINGEAVAEIDIRASQLTIYHAKIGEPLEGSGDPYAHTGIERQIAKQWVVASLGNGKPMMRWPSKMIEDYRRETGEELSKAAKASDVAAKMLAAFPALKNLKNHSDLWAKLQYIEAEAVIGTMLILMRDHQVPALSMHDGIIVPRSKANVAKAILTREFRRLVGVEPRLTVEPEEERKRRAWELAADL